MCNGWLGWFTNGALGDADVEVEFTKSQLVAGIPGGGFCIWYVMKKHWLANNTLGLAFSIQVLPVSTSFEASVEAVWLSRVRRVSVGRLSC